MGREKIRKAKKKKREKKKDQITENRNETMIRLIVFVGLHLPAPPSPIFTFSSPTAELRRKRFKPSSGGGTNRIDEFCRSYIRMRVSLLPLPASSPRNSITIPLECRSMVDTLLQFP